MGWNLRNDLEKEDPSKFSITVKREELAPT